jgi:hypothetical protein
MPDAFIWSIPATPWTWTLSVISTPLDIQMSGKKASLQITFLAISRLF